MKIAKCKSPNLSVSFWIFKLELCILPWGLIPSFPPLGPRNWAGTLGRSVEQGALGHGPDHRPPVFGRGAYVADGLAFSGGLCAGFFCQLFRQDLLFDKGLRLSRPHGRRRDRSEGDPYRFTSTLFPA